MNGPAHWREAERLLESAKKGEVFQYKDIHTAQVHMTAALVAAVIAVNAHKMEPADRHEWQRATDPGYDAGQAPGAAP